MGCVCDFGWGTSERLGYWPFALPDKEGQESAGGLLLLWKAHYASFIKEWHVGGELGTKVVGGSKWKHRLVTVASPVLTMEGISTRGLYQSSIRASI